MEFVRLDKFLTYTCGTSRSEARRLIKESRVTVDGAPADSADAKLCPGVSRVKLDGEELFYSRYVYIMMDKPFGAVCSSDPGEGKGALAFLPGEYGKRGLFTVGRLDKDTTGLLLITNDGDFAHRIISPKSRIPKLYRAKVDGEPNEGDVAAFREGVVLADGTKCLPAALISEPEGNCLVEVYEGKYHQVKRMLASRGLRVLALRRLSIGALKMDETLGEGGFRELIPEELKLFGNLHIDK